MKVKISTRANSYAIYVEKDGEEELAERVTRMLALDGVRWLQEIYDHRYKKIIVLRHVA